MGEENSAVFYACPQDTISRVVLFKRLEPLHAGSYLVDRRAQQVVIVLDVDEEVFYFLRNPRHLSHPFCTLSVKTCN